MSRFIVLPKVRFEDRVSGAIPLAGRQLTPERRQEQIDEVIQVLKDDPVQKEIRERLGELRTKKAAASAVQSNPDHEAVTGAVVVEMTDEQAEQVRRDLPNVNVVPDRVLPLIRPTRPRAGATKPKLKLTTSDRWHLKRLRVLGAGGQRKARYTGQGVTVAVMDTGIFSTHKEFSRGNQPNVVAASYTVDAANWVLTPRPPGTDTQGHGTHVAGLIAGKEAGVAPNAKLIDVALLPNGSATLSDFLLALAWVATQPEIQIITISAGIGGYEPALLPVCERLEAFGVLTVAAIGNEGRNRTRSPGNLSFVLSVGAVDKDDEVCSFSSSGQLMVDNHLYSVPTVVAPGQQIYSCVPGDGDLYEPWDGTSMAAPLVSGLAALMLQADPRIALNDLREKIFQDAVHYLEDEAVRQGGGVIEYTRSSDR